MLKVFFIVSLLILSGCRNLRVIPLEMKDRGFLVEVADTPQSRERGLMWRKKLDRNRGMLFIFDVPGEYAFWMKNTYIPLDIIWIDENKRVVFISKNTQPHLCSNPPVINPRVRAKYVLEVNAGISDEIKLKIGDEVKF